MDFLLRVVAYIVQCLLWIKVAASPTVAGAIFGVILEFYGLKYGISIFGFLGFVVGGFCAEYIRRTIGLAEFFGRLISLNSNQ